MSVWWAASKSNGYTVDSLRILPAAVSNSLSLSALCSYIFNIKNADCQASIRFAAAQKLNLASPTCVCVGIYHRNQTFLQQFFRWIDHIGKSSMVLCAWDSLRRNMFAEKQAGDKKFNEMLREWPEKSRARNKKVEILFCCVGDARMKS